MYNHRRLSSVQSPAVIKCTITGGYQVYNHRRLLSVQSPAVIECSIKEFVVDCYKVYLVTAVILRTVCIHDMQINLLKAFCKTHINVLQTIHRLITHKHNLMTHEPTITKITE